MKTLPSELAEIVSEELKCAERDENRDIVVIDVPESVEPFLKNKLPEISPALRILVENRDGPESFQYESSRFSLVQSNGASAHSFPSQSQPQLSQPFPQPNLSVSQNSNIPFPRPVATNVLQSIGPGSTIKRRPGRPRKNPVKPPSVTSLALRKEHDENVPVATRPLPLLTTLGRRRGRPPKRLSVIPQATALPIGQANMSHSQQGTNNLGSVVHNTGYKDPSRPSTAQSQYHPPMPAQPQPNTTRQQVLQQPHVLQHATGNSNLYNNSQPNTTGMNSALDGHAAFQRVWQINPAAFHRAFPHWPNQIGSLPGHPEFVQNGAPLRYTQSSQHGTTPSVASTTNASLWNPVQQPSSGLTPLSASGYPSVAGPAVNAPPPSAQGSASNAHSISSPAAGFARTNFQSHPQRFYPPFPTTLPSSSSNNN